MLELLLADPATGPDDLQRPGHVIPIRVVEGDTPEASPVAAAAALAVLTGGPPVAALSGVVSVLDPCRMADADELLQIARRTGLAAVTTSALAAALRP